MSEPLPIDREIQIMGDLAMLLEELIQLGPHVAARVLCWSFARVNIRAPIAEMMMPAAPAAPAPAPAPSVPAVAPSPFRGQSESPNGQHGPRPSRHGPTGDRSVAPATSGAVACPICDQAIKSPRGLSPHMIQQHGTTITQYRAQQAQQAASGLALDDYAPEPGPVA